MILCLRWRIFKSVKRNKFLIDLGFGWLHHGIQLLGENSLRLREHHLFTGTPTCNEHKNVNSAEGLSSELSFSFAE